MALRLDDRRRLLLAQIAIERAEMALVLSEVRDAVAPTRMARSIVATLWALLMRQRAAAAGPGGGLLLSIFKGHPLLASTLMAMLPSAGRFARRHANFKRVLVGAMVAVAAWSAWRVTRRK